MQSLPEYADELAQREDLIWPTPPRVKPAKARPYSAELPGIRAVTWDIYGTLLQVADGRMEFDPEPEIRLQVALEKTIHEFNMWNSMTRKPGAPWEYMLQQYRDTLTNERLSGGGSIRRGDLPHVSLAKVWVVLIERLQQKEYQYDVTKHGSVEHFAEKVAFFFHSALQGTAAQENALRALRFISRRGLVQGLLSDAQPFTLLQLVRALQAQGKVPPIRRLLQPELLVLSCALGVRKPSPSLYTDMAERLARNGISPAEVLHVGSRLADDLVSAKRAGFRTALFAGDTASVDAPKETLRDPESRPDRLVTNLAQIARLVGGDPQALSPK